MKNTSTFFGKMGNFKWVKCFYQKKCIFLSLNSVFPSKWPNRTSGQIDRTFGRTCSVHFGRTFGRTVRVRSYTIDNVNFCFFSSIWRNQSKSVFEPWIVQQRGEFSWKPLRQSIFQHKLRRDGRGSLCLHSQNSKFTEIFSPSWNDK